MGVGGEEGVKLKLQRPYVKFIIYSLQFCISLKFFIMKSSKKKFNVKQ